MDIIEDFHVYIFTNKLNGKRYVGISGNESKRSRQHSCAVKRGVSLPLYKAIRKYGEQSFSYEVFQRGLSRSEACELEIALIRILGCRVFEHGYNITAGGDGVLGVSPSEVTRQKLRDFNTGLKRGPMSDVQKQKIAVTKIGEKNPNFGKDMSSHIERLAEGNRGRKHTVEAKFNMAAGQLITSLEQDINIIMLRSLGAQIRDIAAWFSLSVPTIKRRIKGRRGPICLM